VAAVVELEPSESIGSVGWVVDRLDGVVDVLVAVDPAAVSEFELADALVALRRALDRQEAVFARLAHAGHVRGVGAVDGAASTAAWLRHRTGMREGDAKAAIECGEVSELLPATGAAWRDGEIATGAVRTIVAARVEGHDERFVACEAAFLELARAGDERSLRRATAHFRNLARADGSVPRVPDGLHLSRTWANRTVLSAEFGDAAAETVTTALHAYADPPEAECPKPTSQRYADAFVRICEVALARTGTVERPRAQVLTVVDWATLTDGTLGRSDGVFTGPLHPADVRELLCDCSVSRVVTGPESEVLDVGRSRRTIPPSLRRALIVRDGGCAFPSCNRPPGWCDAHHLVHWADGGATSIGNTVLLCDRHHHVLHEPGWNAVVEGEAVRVFRPDLGEVT
jgi:hypothetical protein